MHKTLYTESTLLNFSKRGINSNSSESFMSSNHDLTGTCKERQKTARTLVQQTKTDIEVQALNCNRINLQFDAYRWLILLLALFQSHVDPQSGANGSVLGNKASPNICKTLNRKTNIQLKSSVQSLPHYLDGRCN